MPTQAAVSAIEAFADFGSFANLSMIVHVYVLQQSGNQ